MYKIVYTIGDTETIIAEYDSLEAARAEKKRLERQPEYAVGIVTVESGEGKIRRMW